MDINDYQMKKLITWIKEYFAKRRRKKAFFKKIEEKGFTPNCIPYNAIIKALASRKDYA